VANDLKVAEPVTGPRFSPIQAVALIMGSIIGVGIFNLPTSLARYGPITLVSMGLTTIGAVALALLFASLSRRLPADGGPYAYDYLGSSGATVFTTLVLMTGITSAIPYGFSALAQLKWRWIDHKQTQTPRFVRDIIVAGLSLIFSILFIVYSRNTGNSFWIYWAPFFMAGGALLLGIPVYNAQRRHMTEPPPPPPYR
jgi:amino acid transporter